MAVENGLFWDRFKRSALDVFKRTPLEARNDVDDTEPPPRFNAVVIIYQDEANPVYFPRGETQYNLDLDAWTDWRYGLSEDNQAKIYDPMVNRVENSHDPPNEEAIGQLIPGSEVWPNDEFAPFGVIARSEGVANYTLVPQFELRFLQYLNTRVSDTSAVTRVHFLIDNSGSMGTHSIEPGFMIPDHNGETVQQIIEDQYGYPFEFASFEFERWINETLTYMKGL